MQLKVDKKQSLKSDNYNKSLNIMFYTSTHTKNMSDNRLPSCKQHRIEKQTVA